MLDCTPVPGNPSSTTVMFTAGGLEIHQSDPSVTINNYVLTISMIQRRHRGTYTCTASNGVGNNATADIVVNVVGMCVCIII